MSQPDLDDQGRPEPPAIAGEWETLTGFLDFQRDTLRWKTDGMDDEQLTRNLTSHPSQLTLGSLIKHLAYVESYWFVETVAGESSPEPWAAGDWENHPDWDWVSADDDSGEYLRELWGDAVELSRELVEELRAEHGDAILDADFPRPGRPDERVSLRWVLVHMIEEYARHNGHADLIREKIDGRVGE